MSATIVSPAENDLTRKWNIFHILASQGHNDLLGHLLRKLPPGVVETLLAQQSKGRLNTPLHIAVKRGRKCAVKLFLDFKKSNLLVRDVDGSLPLHAAVRQGFAEITQLLIEAGPAEALLAENGVGETPLETATLQEIIERTRNNFNPNVGTPLQLNSLDIGPSPERFSIPQQEREIAKLRDIVDDLLRDGRLRKNTKLPNELMSFANKMDAKLAAAKNSAAAEAEESDDVKDETDSVNRVETLARVGKALLLVGGQRSLVRLIDVQRSVLESLRQFKEQAANNVRQTQDDGLDLEENEDQNLRSECQVYTFVPVDKDHW